MSTPKFLFRLPQLSIFALGGLLSAQAPASYTLYGEGCNGAPLSHCLTLNDQNPVMTVASLPNEYAYPVVNTTGAAIQIVGFEIYTVSNTGINETGNTSILWDVSGAGATVHTSPSATAISTGTITVGGTQGWYSTAVNPPVVVPAGVAFWFHVDAYSRIAPPQHSTTGGVAGPVSNWYRRPSNNMVWTRSVSVARQIFRLHCLPETPSVPTLNVDVPPRLGQLSTFAVSGGQPFSLGFFFFGFDGAQWGGLPTPVDLGFLGAPGCGMRTSSDVIMALSLDQTGVGYLALVVPPAPSFAGVTFYNQGSVVVPAANALSMIFSNAGVGTIGL